MSFLRVLLLLLLLSLGILIGWGNRTVLLAITVLGSQLPALPLGGLILGAVGLGLSAGILLQILLRRRRRSAARPGRPSTAAAKSRSPRSSQSKKAAKSSAAKSSAAKSSAAKSSAAKSSAAKSNPQRSKSKTTRRPATGSDWDDQPVVDWFGNPTDRAEAELGDRRRTPRDAEPPRRRTASSDRVVDANYRVITPPSGGRPNRPAAPRNPNDEWDDEFFD